MAFPPQSNPTDSMLKDIIARKPKYAFVIEWPEDGSEPSFHTSTSDMPVLAMRLQNFLVEAYSGKLNEKFFIEKE